MFVAADDLTVVTTMLRPMVNDVGLTLPDGLDDAAWIVNVYLIAFVAVMPLAGRLSDVVGRRRLFVGAYGIFLVGTVVIPLSSDLTTLLVGRVLTAVGGGAMVPVALAVVGDVFAHEQRARALGSLGAIETLGWVWGPLYGAMLVRYLDWRWQFWLNIPLAVIGTLAVWWALPEFKTDESNDRVDWVGAVLMALTLITLNLALLGDAEVQSVSGLDELQGRSGFRFAWLFPLAAVLGAGFVHHQRRSLSPLIERAFYSVASMRLGLVVNFVVGAALVIAMVDVPLFVNSLEIDLERAAVRSGWLLAALTLAMSITSFVGGRMTARLGYRGPIVVGMALAIGALVVMGLTWNPTITSLSAGSQLAVLGAGLGLVFAPTTAAVVDAAPPDQRGAAASLVMVVRLTGLSVGLAGLTAWGLARFNSSRRNYELPPISDPGFSQAVLDATAQLTADAISETFLAAAVLTALGLVAAFVLKQVSVPQTGEADMPRPSDTSRSPFT
jgi:MFS family permease